MKYQYPQSVPAAPSAVSSPKDRARTPRGKLFTGLIAASFAAVVLSVSPVHAQYLGATCGYDYNNDLTGPYTVTTDNTPLYNPSSGTASDTWGTWVEQMQQA